MQEQRADLAVWVSAYPGGLPLQMRALENALPIITAVQGKAHASAPAYLCIERERYVAIYRYNIAR